MIKTIWTIIQTFPNTNNLIQMEFQKAQNHSVIRSLNRDLGTKVRPTGGIHQG
jgi:hypothetical protein